MDGSLRPAGELARGADVSAQSASQHLAKLVNGGLLVVQAQGRHRYFRISSAEVATAVERGELGGVDPAQAAFEINAIAQGVNQAIQLHADGEAVARGRTAMRRALGLESH